jgi:hypothetical protein
VVLIGSAMTGINPAIYLVAFPILVILDVAIFFGWFYALGTNLHKKLPPTATMNLVRFKIFLFIPIIYMLLVCVGIFGLVSNLSSGGQLNPSIFAVIVPLHFFCMFCMFYCLYFNAKVLKAVELQKPVTFSEFAGEFFLIWFFPIGIWIIQPRLNKLFDPTAEADYDEILDHNI